ncbi:MAG: ATP-dependent DNA helicase RecG [Syntrophomonadaceae bacterium]|nr:ATP-dependent DNA helicase RecG [Syntrophomonadaceae bacterium]
MDRLIKDLQYIKGVGPKRSRQLHRLGLDTVFDLLWNIPRAYFNRANVNRIAELKDGEAASIKGKICSTGTSRTRGGMIIFKALVEDDSGAITAVWFNQPFMSRIIKPGQDVFLSGKPRRSSFSTTEFNVSEYEIIEDEDIQYQVLPVYALTEGLSQKMMRFITLNSLRDYLDYYPEVLEEKLRKKYNLCPIDYAFNNIHFPDSREAYRQARKRLAVEELFLFQLQIRQVDQQLAQGDYVMHREKTDLLKQLTANFPFRLTSAQKQVVAEIFADMESASPMNRLLQGDVGSGKTVVAALAMAKAVASGFQAAIMAPTEILAQQHYTALERFFSGHGVTVARLTGGTPGADRRLILEALRNGEIDLLVGTHALIQDDVVFDRLGLVVIDEQHRFGVRQRAALSDKGNSPDVLVMTATPIPRTLALTVYGDLSLSVIDELPPGRKAIRTYFIKPQQRQRLYQFIHEQVHNKAQTYIVCPLVEESEKQDLLAAASLYEELKTRVFPTLSVGLIHGRLKPAEKDMVMQMFKQGKIQILVSTSVIEVGVDVPNASIMVIEQAERFGLSQLHQLRGRVGRGHKQSYCFLIADPRNEEAIRRLQAMEKTNDGFELAEEDLRIRGPGEFWGVRQHGLDGLKVANLSKDKKLVELSQVLGEEIRQGQINPQLEKYIALKFKKSNQVAPN